MRPSLRRLVPVVLVLAGADVWLATMVVHDTVSPREWLAPHPPETILYSVAGWIALGVGSVSTIGAIAGLAARARPAFACLGRLEVLALPPVRALLDRGLAVSIGATAVLAPAAAFAQSSDTPVLRVPPATARATPDEPVVRGERVPQSPTTAGATTATATPTTTATPTPTGSGRPGSQAPGSFEYVVVPGDHLWGIAERHLAAKVGTVPRKQDVADYWSRVIAGNRARLRSGNPNLIFPGEVIVLPALT